MHAVRADGVPCGPKSFGQAHRWKGRSGTVYPLTQERLDDFALTGRELHLLARGGRVLWVGSVSELVADPGSRERFRGALAAADAVYSLDSPDEEAAGLTLAWDLEGAERMGALSMA